MAARGVVRKLTAILAADVVGYSRLMGADEAGTLARLKAHRAELIDPAIAEHGGRTVKLMGDGTLVEFASVVEAVACAVASASAVSARSRASSVATIPATSTMKTAAAPMTTGLLRTTKRRS